jgi:hypothetical protein
MHREISVAIGCAAILCLASADLPAQQPSTRSLPLEPAPIEPKVTLTPEQQTRLQALINRWLLQQQQMAGKTPLANAHSLLDQALTGDQLPAEIRPSFVELLAPSRKDLHQFLDQQSTRLQQQFKKGGQSGGPRSGIEQPMVMARPISHRAKNQGLPMIARRGYAAPHSVGNSLLYLTQSESSESFSGTVDGFNLTATGSEGVTQMEASRDMENGTKVRITGEDWHDTDNWVGEGGGLGMEVTGEKKECLALSVFPVWTEPR